MPEATSKKTLFVPETRFGFWFLGTETWVHQVLKVAVRDLTRLLEPRCECYPVVVDVGCGQGHSFRVLQDTFHPQRLIGIELEEENLQVARQRAADQKVSVELLKNDCAAINLPDACADLVFCHQTFHHLVQQERADPVAKRSNTPEDLWLQWHESAEL